MTTEGSWQEAPSPGDLRAEISRPDQPTDAAPIVLIHGWGCDRSFLAPQQRHFATRRPVMAVDLRGHGDSGSPERSYAVADFAGDVAAQCLAAEFDRPILVGHSLGGQIALACAADRRIVVRAVVLIDSFVFLPEEVAASALARAQAVEDHGPEPMLSALEAMMMLPSDGAHLREEFARSLLSTDRGVLAATLRGQARFDAAAALRASDVPLAYVAAERLVSDERRLTEIRPDARIGRVIGSGHFSPLVAPGQINAMLDGFIVRDDLG